MFTLNLQACRRATVHRWLILFGVLAPFPLLAQIDIFYNPGEIDTTSYDTYHPGGTFATFLTLTAFTTFAEQRGVLYDIGGIRKEGTGTLALTATNTYTGGTTIAAGTLQIGAGGTSGSILGHVLNDGTLAFDRSDALVHAGDVSGSGSLIQRGIGVLTLTGAISHTGGTTISSGTLQVGAGGTSGSIAGDITNHSALAFNRSDALTYAGTLSGSGSLSKAGSGTLTLTGANSYSGATTVTGGLVNFSSFANFGTSIITLSGGGLQWSSGNTFDITASSQLNRTLGAGGATFDTNGNNVTFSTALSGAGALTKSGAGILTLAVPNTHTGGTRVTGGLIHFHSLATFGSGAITLDGGGLRWATATTTDVSSRLAALGLAGGSFDTNGSTVSFASALSGAGPLTKTGAGFLTLTQASTYSGNTTVSGGRLILQNTTLSPAFAIASGAALELHVSSGTRNNPASTLFTGAGNFVKTGDGILRWDSSVATFALGAGSLIDVQAGTLVGGSFGNDVWTNNLSGLHVAASGTFIGSQANVRVAALTGSGLIRSGYNGAGYSAFTFGLNDASGTFSGQLADYIYPEGQTGPGHFVKVGSGTQTLTGVNTYSGGTTLNGGLINFNSMANFGTGAVTVNGGGLQWATGNTTDVTASAQFNRTLGAGGATFDTNGNHVVFSTALSGSGALRKTGVGTLTLAGVNTYSGGTTVSGGTLRAQAGSLSSTTGGVSIRDGGTLDLDGATHALSGLSSIGNRIVGNLGNGILNLSNDLYYQSGTTTATLQGAGRLFIGGDAGATVTLNGTNNMVAAGGQSQVIIGSDTIGLAGTVRLGNAHALAAANTTVEVNTGTLDLNGQTDVRALAINLGYTYFAPDYQIRFGSLVNNDSANAASFGGAVSTVDLHDIGGEGSLTLSGVISGWGITKIGSGTLTLTGNNTFQGGVWLGAGTLALGSANALGAPGSPLYFDGGTLRYLPGGAADHSIGFYNYTNAAYNIDTNGQDVTYASALTGGRALNKFGDGTLTLAAAATGLADGTAVFGGTLALRGGDNRLPTDSSVYLENATLDLGDFDQTMPLIIAYASNIMGTGTLTTSGMSELTNSTIAANLAGIGEFMIANSTLSGTNTYSGQTTIYQTVRIGTGGETGTLGTGAVSVSYSSNLTFDRSNTIAVGNAISGAGSVTQAGTGSLELSGANTYTGGTTIHSGTLIAANNQAVGTGIVTVECGVFFVDAGVTVANDVVLSGGAYFRSLGAGADLSDAINAKSSFATGRADTTAKILQGTLGAQATLESRFQEHSAALNDAIRLSDVYSLHGTGGNLFVLQLSITGLNADSYLGWLDTDTGSATYNEWINAVEGNSGGTPTFFARGYNAATDFHLGYYGVDVEAGTVWAVLDHNSDFAVVPEPGTGALLMLGLGALLFKRRGGTQKKREPILRKVCPLERGDGAPEG